MDDHFDICRVFEINKFDIVWLTCKQKITFNNPNLDLVNINDYKKKIAQILSICSQNIEGERNSDINQGP